MEHSELKSYKAIKTENKRRFEEKTNVKAMSMKTFMMIMMSQNLPNCDWQEKKKNK